MAAAGNLVFQGMGDGTFRAFDARNGKALWQFDAHFGIAGAPISYEVEGQQRTCRCCRAGAERAQRPQGR